MVQGRKRFGFAPIFFDHQTYLEPYRPHERVLKRLWEKPEEILNTKIPKEYRLFRDVEFVNVFDYKVSVPDVIIFNGEVIIVEIKTGKNRNRSKSQGRESLYKTSVFSRGNFDIPHRCLLLHAPKGRMYNSNTDEYRLDPKEVGMVQT